MPLHFRHETRTMANHFLITAAMFLCISLLATGCRKATTPAPPITTAPVVEETVASDVGEPHADETIATPNPFELKTIGDGLQAADLPARTTSNGKRFASLSVEQSGLDFGHNWSPPEGYRLEVYNSLPGGSVCVGDYDGDGWPDIFLTQPNVGSKLYRNLGGLRFEDVTSKTINANAKALGASFIDIDNDSDLDLYICNNGQPNQLYINDGKGGFTEQAKQFGIDTKTASVMASFADYDRDGDLDLYLVTNRTEPDEKRVPIKDANGNMIVAEEDLEYIDVIEAKDESKVISAGRYDHLFRNNGDNTFTDVTREANITGNFWGLSATWWDYDRDGWPDLYVSNDYYGPDQLFRNNGDGTFEDVAKQSFPHTPWYSMGTDAADINNDGWMDFMGADMSGSNHYKQKASMGDMSTTGWFLVHPTPRQYMRNALYLHTGTDRFMEIAQLAGVANTDWTWSLKFGDLDEDGWSDLFVTNGMNRDWTNSDIRNKSSRATTEEEKIQIWLDSPQRRDANLAYRNGGNLKFVDTGNDWGLGGEHVSYGAAYADLDRDGDLDIVVNNAEETAGLYRNDTNDSHRVLLRLVGTNSNAWGVGATVTATLADGVTLTRYINSCQGYMAANEPLVHFGLGDREKITSLEILWPNGGTQNFDDLAADKFYVIEETKTPGLHAKVISQPLFSSLPLFDGIKHEETPFNDYVRQPLLPNQLSQLGPTVASGDVDGNGTIDFVVGGASGQPTRCLINDGKSLTAKTSKAFAIDTDSEDLGTLLFDADGDEDLDMYVVSGSVECEPDDPLLQDRLYLNDGKGTFTRATDSLPEMLSSGLAVRGGDFDQDGDTDLFVGGRVIPGQYPAMPSSYLLRNDGGKFTDVTDEYAPGLKTTGLVTDAKWCDANGDGSLDLLVAHEWGPIKLYQNEQGHLVDQTKQSGLASSLGWWNKLATCDVDNDGDMDFVAGNFGWNTKYHASEEQPTLLYYGDFENTGRKRLVEAEYEDEKLFPVRGKSCSTNAMPFLGNKFGTFHAFASASLEDIYSTKSLDTSLRFAANTLTSGIFINNGQGGFKFRPLPTLAQVSPICGIVTGHFDSDEHLDIVLAQNFFGPQPETGHFDGGVGLLLRGTGDGSFLPVMPGESGIVVPEDATDAILVDIDRDGTEEIIVPTNDGPIHLFGKRALDPRDSWSPTP